MLNNIGLAGLPLLLIVGAVLVIIPFWKLLPKFGYSSWIALVALVPVGALILIWVLAFSDPKTSGAA